MVIFRYIPAYVNMPKQERCPLFVFFVVYLQADDMYHSPTYFGGIGEK